MSDPGKKRYEGGKGCARTIAASLFISLRARHRPITEPAASPSGWMWVVMTKLSAVLKTSASG
jgi:hypothetical protein